MFRPEFLQVEWKKPLSSDAFTGFGCCRECVSGTCHHCAVVHHDDAAAATIHLTTVTIPAMARRINDAEIAISDNLQLVAAMHSGGVNFRFLGLLRSHVTAPWPRECMLLEMIARCLRTYEPHTHISCMR